MVQVRCGMGWRGDGAWEAFAAYPGRDAEHRGQVFPAVPRAALTRRCAPVCEVHLHSNVETHKYIQRDVDTDIVTHM
jgi:hypothetical protein